MALESFPIYFFSDEAANTVLAADLVRDGFSDASGRLLPIYFPNSGRLNLGLSVYVQVIPYLLFGRSVFVTRAVSVVFAMSGAIAAGLILKNVFHVRSAWLGILLLTITPAWFLHSRTAFETTLFVSMYSWFLYFYMRYRQDDPPALLPAVVFAGLAFYTYSAGQPVLILTALLFLLMDLRHHWRNRRTAWAAFLLALVVSIPQVTFEAEHPGEITRRLHQMDSYLVRPGMTLPDKAAHFVREYAVGIGPFYWFAPDNGRDLIRHQMKGYGNVLWPTLPLGLWGLVVAIRHRDNPVYRAGLAALLAAPVGGALTETHITRVLVTVVPIALLTAIGAAQVLSRLERRLSHTLTSTATFGLITIMSGLIVRDAIVNGPTWYSDYGLWGMQYGAREVFQESEAWLARHPDSEVWIFPTWLNGSDMLRRFFAPDEPRIHLLSLDSFLASRFNALTDALVVLSSEDYRQVMGTGKFAKEELERTLPLPDGRIGFYFVRLSYAPGADDLFAAENAARLQMVEERAFIAGRNLTIRHTPFDEGDVTDLFDGNPETLVRTAGINPAVIDIEFPEPVSIIEVGLITSATEVSLSIKTYARQELSGGLAEAVFSTQLEGPALNLTLTPNPGPIVRLVIELLQTDALPTSYVHLRDINLFEVASNSPAP